MCTVINAICKHVGAPILQVSHIYFGTDFDDFTAILLLLQSSFYIGNCYNQCNILIIV